MVASFIYSLNTYRRLYLPAYILILTGYMFPEHTFLIIYLSNPSCRPIQVYFPFFNTHRSQLVFILKLCLADLSHSFWKRVNHLACQHFYNDSTLKSLSRLLMLSYMHLYIFQQKGFQR